MNATKKKFEPIEILRPVTDPGTPITLCEPGKPPVELRLCYDLDAIKAILAETQVSILKGFNMSESLSNPDTLLAILHHGLRVFHPQITREQLSKMVTARSLTYVATVVGIAVTGVMPFDEDSLKENEGQQPDPTKTTLGVN